MTKKEFKNCPFCGDIAECTANYEETYFMYKVECSGCFSSTNLYPHPDLATEKWNTRLKEIDDLEKAQN